MHISTRIPNSARRRSISPLQRPPNNRSPITDNSVRLSEPPPPIHDSRFTIHRRLFPALPPLKLGITAPSHPFSTFYFPAARRSLVRRRLLSTSRVKTLRTFTLPRQRERLSAFTLIELIIVITLIAILIGLLFPAINGAQKQAKKVQAKNDLVQIVTAVNAFYTEYGKYPTNATTDVTYGPGGSPTENGGLFNELQGLSNTFNTRKIVFINPPNAKDQNNPRSGIRVSTGGYYDPWGTEYAVAMDANYNNIVVAPSYTDLQSNYSTATDGSGDKGVTTGVIAWSLGADTKLGNNGDSNYKGSDDVISWQ